MISFLRGIIKDRHENCLTIESNNIGFAVAVPSPSQFVAAQSVELFIQFTWNQEQGPQLYGFLTQDEKVMFNLITSCSGIGPKLALALLNMLSPATIAAAIAENQPKILSNVSGVGAKKAENIILQLKDKINKLVSSGFAIEKNAAFEHLTNLTQVLQSLGYSAHEINHASSYVKNHLSEINPLSFDGVLKKAFSALSK